MLLNVPTLFVAHSFHIYTSRVPLDDELNYLTPKYQRGSYALQRRAQPIDFQQSRSLFLFTVEEAGGKC